MVERLPKKYIGRAKEAEEMSEEDGLFYEALPFSDLKAWIPEDGVYEDVWQNFDIGRLSNIKALGFITFNSLEGAYHLGPHHSRLDHVLVCAMVMERIFRQNHFSETEIKKGVIAGLIHDIAMPALGDAVIRVDAERLDEEKHWREFLTEDGVSMLDRYGFKPEELDEAICNGSLLGRILDIADRVTYVCKDLDSVASHYSKVNDWKENPILLELFSLAKDRYLPIGNIYHDVRVKNGEVYFSRPERLARFLRLRILLHQQFYLHPASQARDLVVSALVKRFYSPDDPRLITPQKLRTMTDGVLLADLARRYPPASDLLGSFFFWKPGFCRIDSPEDEMKQAQRLQENPDVIILGKRRIRKVDLGVDYRVRNTSGRIVGFKDFDPETAKELCDLASRGGEYLLFADTRERSLMEALLREMKKDGMFG